MLGVGVGKGKKYYEHYDSSLILVYEYVPLFRTV